MLLGHRKSLCNQQQCHGAHQWHLLIGHVQKHVVKSSLNDTAVSGQAADVRDGRLSLPEQLQQFVSPQKYAASVMQGAKYAWGKTNVPPRDTVFVADPTAARHWLSNEWNLGTSPDWLPSISALLGNTAVSMTQDPQLHTRLRQLMNPYFTAEAIQRQMPAIHKKVQAHMAGWASRGSIGAYDAARLLTFDILVNQALSLQMNDQELLHYSKVFREWVDGFTPPAFDLPFLPFGKGMAARCKLQQRAWQALADPNIPANSLLARLRDEYGAESATAVDNIITMLFAGHDTTSSVISFLIWQLSKKPEVLQKLRREHEGVVAAHGSELTTSAVAAMPYTQAVMKESLRMAQVGQAAALEA